MTSRWFKMPETLFLDRRLQKLPASLFRTWVNLLAVASWSGGALPTDRQDLAFLLHLTPGALSRRLGQLQEAGLVSIGDDGEIVILGAVKTGDCATDDRPAPMSAAERQRAWRERRRGERVTKPETPTVTGETAIEKEKDIETDSSRVTRGERDENSFDQFLASFPTRDEPTPRGPTLAAWRKAIAEGATAEHLIAAAKRYAASTAGRERRFVASAVRWLGEGRWKDDRPAPTVSTPAAEAPGVWISADSDAGRAWASFYRETKGRTPPIDSKGGWRFPSPMPPIGMTEVAA